MIKATSRQWYGKIGRLMQDHIALRRAMGRVGEAESVCLNQFNRFLHKEYPKLGVPNRYVILHFLNTQKHLSPWGRRNKVIYIRQFCRFINQRGISCYVPDKTLTPKLVYKPRYFPLHVSDVKALMLAVRSAGAEPFLGESYSTMIGLMWCTGMRRREIACLNHCDIDLTARTILIRETKFKKRRMIPFDKSVAGILQKYLAKKKRLKYLVAPDALMFATKDGSRLESRLQLAFEKAVKRTGLYKGKQSHPVLHDLRHNFATRTLRRFYSEADKWPSQTLHNVLATYLGHSDLLYSQYYLHPDFDLLLKASARFETKRKAA